MSECPDCEKKALEAEETVKAEAAEEKAEEVKEAVAEAVEDAKDG